MANIQIFTSPEFGDIRTVDQNGEPWFVGKDVAAALGYGNPQKAIRDHVDEQDRGVNEMDTPGGKQPIAIINESGLYSLIFGSKLEGAVRFKRWVTSEVLPALRKTGSYMMPKLSKEMQALFMLDTRTQRQEERLTALENTMTVDYNQQRVLRKSHQPGGDQCSWRRGHPGLHRQPCAQQGVQRVQPRCAGLVPGEQRGQYPPQAL